MTKIDKANLPVHVAIIMDGNGRWAAKNSLRRIAGHKAGVEAVRSVVTAARELGIQYLTLYAFSAENWLRPDKEVNALMRLLGKFLKKELSTMLEKDIRLTAIGNIQSLPEDVGATLVSTIQKTAKNKAMVLNLALSYGGRDEIVRATRNILGDVKKGRLKPGDLTGETFSDYLYTAKMPDPDLLIRTSGEYRLSNFLLWQTAYTEFYFTNVLWPDFRKDNFLEAIAEYQKRERRFGMTSEQLSRL